MSSLVGQITTHRADALSRVLTQSRDRPNLTAVLGNLGDMAQAFEDMAYPVLDGRMLDKAEGVQLDGLGQLVGQPRNGQPDATYRLFLAGRVYANSSDSSVETLLALVRQVFGASTAQIVSAFSAGYSHRRGAAVVGLEVGTPTVDPALYPSATQVLKDSLAATVRLAFVTVFDAAGSFALASDLTGSGLDGKRTPLGLANLIYSDAGA